MSADNFVVIRKKDDGYYWGSFSASYWWHNEDEPFLDSDFTDGPFETEEEAEENAEEKLSYIEYGFEDDRPVKN